MVEKVPLGSPGWARFADWFASVLGFVRDWTVIAEFVETPVSADRALREKRSITSFLCPRTKRAIQEVLAEPFTGVLETRESIWVDATANRPRIKENPLPRGWKEIVTRREDDLAKGRERELDIMRSTLRVDEATQEAKFRTLLEFRGKQLSAFYWPLYCGLQKDNVIWRRILDKRDAKDDLRKRVGALIEQRFVIPNHERMVALIEANLYLAEADHELEALLLRYIRHVSVYKAIREAGEENIFPLKLGEEWPHDLFPKIEEKTKALQAEYDMLLRQRTAENLGVSQTTQFQSAG